MDCIPSISLRSLKNPAKYSDLDEAFKKHFDTFPIFYSRVPGRVNLIGEHIDYCGYGVLPMAIDQDIVMAVNVNCTGRINLFNLDSEVYQEFSSPIADLSIDKSCPKWFHYFVCGYRGIAEKRHIDELGLDVLVKGTVPPSSGLSSSSALVCASALATAFVHSILFTKMDLAALCANCERYIGTEGGGMDQAIGFLAESGSAKLIEFNPLRATNVPLPKGICLVVSNSCVAMNKAASSQFNIRVMECRLATKILAKLNGLNWHSVTKLAEIQIMLQNDLASMKDMVAKYLHLECYDRNEICKILEITDAELGNLLSENTKDLQKFKLTQRALHVYGEAARVHKFKEICDNGGKMEDLGNLMNESHESCRDLYECSHPDLDELVEICLQAGALGSRLTGAGWGGCCVSLVEESKIDKFLKIVKEEYYDRRKAVLNTINISNALFVTKPSSGACVYVKNGD